MDNIRANIFRGAFLLFWLIVQSTVFGQGKSSLPMADVIAELEKAHEVQFYYQNDWLDSLVFSGEFQSDSLENKL